MTSYKVNVGINYPPEKRAEPGDIVDDIPEKSLPWLLSEGIVTEVGSEPESDPIPEVTEIDPEPEVTEASEKGGDE